MELTGREFKLKKLMVLFLTIVTVFSAIISNTVTYAYAAYTDVFSDHWAYEAINYATVNKWINGYSDGSFMPNKTISRAETAKVLVTVLSRDLKQEQSVLFTDVEPEQWYAPYVCAAYDLFPDAESGYSFRPNSPVTRETVVFALVRAFRLNRKIQYLDEYIVSDYVDAGEITPEVMPEVAAGVQLGLISGYSDSTLKPQNPLTRAEFVTLLHRAALLRADVSKEELEETAKDTDYEQIRQEEELLQLFTPEQGTFQFTIVELINQIRRESGVPELIVDNNLTYVAQIKAEDMNNTGYFDDVSPTYGNIGDMLETFSVNYRSSAGQNISKGITTPEETVQNWMNQKKPGLRIKYDTYTRIGVGYAPGTSICVVMFVG